MVVHDVRLAESVTPAIENYLKAILKLEQENQAAEIMRLSERLDGIKPASVTAMVKRMDELGFVRHTPYQAVVLTPLGRKIALEVMRHHRLIELYLVEALGYSWDEVHDEAELLEHYISEKLEARIAAKLGDPKFDPHGDPIPALDGSIPSRSTMSLSDCQVGRAARVSMILDQNPERLRQFDRDGLAIGSRVVVLARDAFEGGVTCASGTSTVELDRKTASSVHVSYEEN